MSEPHERFVEVNPETVIITTQAEAAQRLERMKAARDAYRPDDQTVIEPEVDDADA